jgi:hypothetical protein
LILASARALSACKSLFLKSSTTPVLAVTSSTRPGLAALAFDNYCSLAASYLALLLTASLSDWHSTFLSDSSLTLAAT